MRHTCAMSLRLQLLGGLEVLRNGEPVALPQSKKTRALLAYLVLTGREHRRDRLCTLFWDVADDPRAALRWVLSKLRSVIDDESKRLVADRTSVAVDLDAMAVDLFEVRDRLAPGLTEVAEDDLADAAGILGEDLLEGLDLHDFDAFQAWLLAEREEVHQLRVSVLRELIARQGQDEARVRWARDLVAVDPLDAEARLELVRALVRLGRRVEAEQHVESAKRALAEVGRSVPVELRRALRTPSPPSVAPSAIPEVEPSVHIELSRDRGLVGRSGELAALKRVFDRVVADRRPHGVLIQGQAGIGKSRLMEELREVTGARTLWGRAFEAETTRAYGPWTDGLHQLGDRGPAGLLELCLSPPAMDRPEQLYRVFTDAIQQWQGDDPLLLVLDDVQWSDAASMELLHATLRLGADRPTAFAVAARDGELPDNPSAMRVLRALRRQGQLTDLDLGPLEDACVAALVERVAPGRSTRDVVAESGGNPLFAIELARVAEGRELPPTLARMVRDRLSLLTPESVDALRWASVLGQTFGLGCLRRLVPLDELALLDALESLESHGLIAESSTSSDRYQFAHDLVRKVVYGQLSAPRRRLMHGRAARSYQEDEGVDAQVVHEIVHHASLAGDHDAASSACIRAGWRAVQVFANHEALALVRRGSHHAALLGEPQSVLRRIDLLGIAFAAHTPEDPEAMAAELTTLGETALALGQGEKSLEAFRLVSWLRWWAGDYLQARTLMLRAAEAHQSADPTVSSDRLAEAATCLIRLERDLSRAEAMTHRADALAQQNRLDSPLVHQAAGMLHLFHGRPEAAIVRLRNAQQLASARQDRHLEFDALEFALAASLQAGDLPAARDFAHRLRSLGDRMREGSEGPCGRALESLVALLDGQDGAQEAFEAAVEELRQADARHRLSFALGRAALFAVEQERNDLAIRWGTEALAHGSVAQGHSDFALAHLVLARAWLGKGDVSKALEHRSQLTDPALQNTNQEVRSLVGELEELSWPLSS